MGSGKMRPPQRSRASTMVTLLPARASSRAVIRPAAPAPTIRKAVKCREAIMLGDVGLDPVLASGRERHEKYALELFPGLGGRETNLLRILDRPRPGRASLQGV